jgi:fructose transport system substrate-binding protein
VEIPQTLETSAAIPSAVNTIRVAPPLTTIEPDRAPKRKAASEVVGNTKQIGVSLILKNLTNPFFVSMEKDAMVTATKLNARLTVVAGKTDSEVAIQIAGIEAAIANGDSGILITPISDDVELSLDRARIAGLLVVALDTPPHNRSAVDLTFAANSYEAGQLIGQWTNRSLGGTKAVIAMLDLFSHQVEPVDTGRDQGFLNGMGIVGEEDKTGNGKEAPNGQYGGGGDYEIVCHEETYGNVNGGRSAMETCLAKNPDINVIYAVNDPAAQGAYDVMKAAGKENGVLIVSVDGACDPGVRLVSSGVIAATAQIYPGRMASAGLSAVVDFSKGKPKPSPTPGFDFRSIASALVTDKPIKGLSSLSSANGRKTCW